MQGDIGAWLEELGLDRFAGVFAEHEVDLEILPELSDDDLKSMGLPLGVRRRLQRALAAASTSPESPPSELDRAGETSAERRQLTILFCDIVGSTALSTRLDPEDLSAVFQRFQHLCTQEVERYGGYVAKFMGDGALAYFGYPEAHENDAERAILAGLDLVTAMADGRGGEPTDERPTIRVGIATGPVVVGDLIGREASQEAAVVGATPNLAARLQGLADPDTVVIDDATRRLVDGLFQLRDLGSHELKGFGTDRRAWAVEGRLRAESRFSAVRGATLNPLVGRDEELELLLRRWRRATEGQGQLVLIAAEPGIGKSRLVHAATVEIGREPNLRLRYQCSPFHTNSALHPVIEQLERAADFEPGDEAAVRLEKLVTLIGLAGRPVEEDAPWLAELLSIPIEGRNENPAVSPPRKKELIIETLLAQLTAHSARQPVLFILEDAHWIDPTTQDLLDRTIERLSDLPVLMVVTHRPDYVAPWIGRPQATLLTLNRLDPAESAQLAELSGGRSLPDAVLAQIIEKTDGVPLFIEEFTRAALEQDETGAPVAIPATLQDVLEARLGRLEHGRKLAQIGAALGRTFEHRLLAAVVGDDPALLPALEELAVAQLIFVRGDPPDASYTFKHALVQDTAYESMLRARRVELHGRIAEVLENEFPGLCIEQPEILAHHLTEGERIECAIPQWQSAGEIAARRSAVQEAIHHFGRALALLEGLPESEPDLARQLAIQLQFGPLYMALLGFGSDEARVAFGRAFELAEQIGDADQAFAAEWGMWMMNLQHPRKGVARRLIEEMLERTAEDPDSGSRLQACHASWTTNFFQGRFVEVEKYAEEGRRIYDIERHADHKFRFGAHDPACCGRSFYAASEFARGRPDRALALAREAVELAERIAHPLSLIAAHTWLVKVLCFRREPLQSRDSITRSVDLAEDFGISSTMWCGAYQGWIAAHEGHLAEGLEMMQQMIDAEGTVGAESFRPFFCGILAQLYGWNGRAEEGLAQLELGLTICETGERGCYTADLYRIRGEIQEALGRPAVEIEESYRRALDIATQQQASMLALRAATPFARFWVEKGRPDTAREILVPAYAAVEEGHDLLDLAEARAVLESLGSVPR